MSFGVLAAALAIIGFGILLYAISAFRRTYRVVKEIRRDPAPAGYFELLATDAEFREFAFNLECGEVDRLTIWKAWQKHERSNKADRRSNLSGDSAWSEHQNVKAIQEVPRTRRIH